MSTFPNVRLMVSEKRFYSQESAHDELVELLAIADRSDGPVLTIDPKRQFGRVCIDGGRAPADVVAQCVAAGESVDETADDYGITRDQVLLACWWYATSGAGRSKFDRAIRAAWIGEDLEGVVDNPSRHGSWWSCFRPSRRPARGRALVPSGVVGA